jgi:hypothetical protein
VTAAEKATRHGNAGDAGDGGPHEMRDEARVSGTGARAGTATACSAGVYASGTSKGSTAEM